MNTKLLKEAMTLDAEIKVLVKQEKEILRLSHKSKVTDLNEDEINWMFDKLLYLNMEAILKAQFALEDL